MYSEADDVLKIGVFSASSNLTGVLTDTTAVTSLLHNYNCLAFWDYATAGNKFSKTFLLHNIDLTIAPYVKIDMNPVTTRWVCFKLKIVMLP